MVSLSQSRSFGRQELLLKLSGRPHCLLAIGRHAIFSSSYGSNVWFNRLNLHPSEDPNITPSKATLPVSEFTPWEQLLTYYKLPVNRFTINHFTSSDPNCTFNFLDSCTVSRPNNSSFQDQFHQVNWIIGTSACQHIFTKQSSLYYPPICKNGLYQRRNKWTRE